MCVEISRKTTASNGWSRPHDTPRKWSAFCCLLVTAVFQDLATINCQRPTVNEDYVGMRSVISRGMDAALRALVTARQLKLRWKEVVDVHF